MEAAALAFFSSLVLGAVLLSTRRAHQRYSLDEVSVLRRKVHVAPAPRIGGVAIFGGAVLGSLLLPEEARDLGVLLAAIGLPAFLGGFSEDLTRRVSALARLLWVFVAAGIAFFALDARITDLDLPGSERVLGLAAASLLFTMFAVGGFSHSLNIVDGLHGLAAFAALMMLLAIAYVAHTVGDDAIALLALVAAGAVAGFLVWNFPRGALFLGDGGSYFLGFLVAVLALMLVHRNTEVSPWFALAALFYPVWETLFRAYRRKARRGVSPMAADGLHLHTLVYKRLVRREGRGTANDNSAATVYLALLCASAVAPAALFWNNTTALQAVVLVFAALYLICYRALVRTRVPWWLALRGVARRLKAQDFAGGSAVDSGKTKTK